MTRLTIVAMTALLPVNLTIFLSQGSLLMILDLFLDVASTSKGVGAIRSVRDICQYYPDIQTSI